MALFVGSGNASSRRKEKNANVRKNLLAGIRLTDEGRRVMTDVLKVFSGVWEWIDVVVLFTVVPLRVKVRNVIDTFSATF